MTRRSLALGVDLGTGSARAYLFDADGRRMGGVRVPYAWRVTGDGGVEADADALVRLVCTAIDGALACAPTDRAIVAVGISALWHTLLGVDGAGHAVTPAYAWNDTRATAAAARLRAALDGEAVHARTGAVLHPSYPPAKLLWLRTTHPPLFGLARRWLSVPEYVWLRLTGEARVDVSIAAGSGLLDRRTLDWDAELLAAAGVERTQLGEIAHEETALVPAAASLVAAKWPRLRGARWRLPVGDGACANLGCGCGDGRAIALSLGTSAALRVVVPAGATPPPAGLWLYALDRQRALLGGALSNGGSVRAWLRATMRLPADGAELDALLAARPAAAHGLVVLPFLAGERSPDWPLAASATISGVGLATSPLDLLQAGMESVAYRLELLRGRVRAAAPATGGVVASGAALERSPYWAQLIADVFGEPLHLAGEAEASGLGAALLAFAAAGVIDSPLDVALPHAAVIEPDAARHAAHAAALARHVEAERLHSPAARGR